MSDLGKLYEYLKPGTTEWKAVVHAYFHLLQWERWNALIVLGMMSDAPNWMLENFQDSAQGHLMAFDVQIEEFPHWREYLYSRQLTRMEWRVKHQADSIMKAGERHARANTRDRKAENKRRRRYRQN